MEKSTSDFIIKLTISFFWHRKVLAAIIIATPELFGKILANFTLLASHYMVSDINAAQRAPGVKFVGGNLYFIGLSIRNQ